MATMEPLAIIGMACQFPQEGDNNENFWKMLMTGKSAMTRVPKNRFNMDGHFHPDVEHGGTVSQSSSSLLQPLLLTKCIVSCEGSAFHGC
jgi:acyl transferase domain-containing protein